MTSDVDHEWIVPLGDYRYGILGVDSKETWICYGSDITKLPIPFYTFVALASLLLIVVIGLALRVTFQRGHIA